MAETIITVKFIWDNNVEFKVTTKEDDGATLNVLQMHENGNISALFPAAKDLVDRYIKTLMVRIDGEMKPP